MSSETDILQAMIAAGTGVSLHGEAAGPEPDLWPDFLTLLGAELRADAVALQFEPVAGGSRIWQVGNVVLPDQAGLRQMRFDRVYSQDDLPGLAARRQPLRALKCAVRPAGFAVLAVQKTGPDFRAIDAARLSGLLPYLGQVLASWQALAQERARQALDAQVGTALGGGWMVLSEGGSVLEMAAQTRDWLRGFPALRLLANGRLDFRDEEIAQQFRHALTVAQTGGAVPALRLGGDPPAEMVIRAGTSAGKRVVLGLLRHLRPARALAVEQVAAVSDLSRSEARLALLLCDGATLAEAAVALGWTLETARSCSKQIFARMGVSGQPAVLRRMLGGALWLA